MYGGDCPRREEERESVTKLIASGTELALQEEGEDLVLNFNSLRDKMETSTDLPRGSLDLPHDTVIRESTPLMMLKQPFRGAAISESQASKMPFEHESRFIAEPKTANVPSSSFWSRWTRRKRFWLLLLLIFVVIVLAIVLPVELVNHSGSNSSGASTPQVSDLKTSLRLLSDNDLSGDIGDAAIVLETPKTAQEAKAVCSGLGEELSNFAPATYATILPYLIYSMNSSSDSLFWIAGTGDSASTCRAVDPQGNIQSFDCTKSLVALCTNTAPVGSVRNVDASTQWQVQVQAGQLGITGFRDRRSFRFAGIRYAPQPQRFGYSTVYEGSGHQDALAPGSICLQKSGTGSEDCLFLNIWTPYLPLNGGSTNSLKPVMVFIHGGAFVIGSSIEPIFDGGNLASRGDVVMVTINYRLAVLGFLAIPDGTTNGNFGIADQSTALSWIKANIAAFGGDPDRVTIFGQSAGASSVQIQLENPAAAGTFAAAISESNPGGDNYGTSYSEFFTIKDSYNFVGKKVLDSVDCQDVDCLRQVKNPSDLFAQQVRYPVVDGKYISTSRIMFNGSSGTLAPVPLIVGVVADDAALFVPPVSNDSTLESMLQQQGFAPGVAFRLASSGLWNDSSGVTRNDTVWTTDALEVFNASASVGTDAMFRCLGVSAAAVAAQHNSTGRPVWYFEFDRTYIYHNHDNTVLDNTGLLCDAPITPGSPNGDPALPYYRCHTGELAYVFGNIRFLGLPLRDDTELAFMQFVLDTWVQFAWTLDASQPNIGWLTARGYNSTIEQMQTAGTWKAVDPDSGLDGLTMRVWDTVSRQSGFVHSQQCQELGLGILYDANPG